MWASVAFLCCVRCKSLFRHPEVRAQRASKDAGPGASAASFEAPASRGHLRMTDNSQASPFSRRMRARVMPTPFAKSSRGAGLRRASGGGGTSARSCSSKKGKRNAGRRVIQPPHQADAARAKRRALACRRSTTALAAANQHRSSAPERASWDAAESGCCPPPPVPVQRRSRRPVVMPAGRFPGTARERR
jgi:hypothetical protein